MNVEKYLKTQGLTQMNLIFNNSMLHVHKNEEALYKKTEESG